MEPINGEYVTSSTTEIKAGMKYPTLEVLTNLWDNKENVNKREVLEDSKQSFIWSILGKARTTEGTAYYYAEDESTNINDKRTYREFKVSKVYKDENGLRDFRVDFYCSNNHTENTRSPSAYPSSPSANTIFNYVRVGNQYAIDTHNPGIVDEDEIYTIDENK